MADNGLSVDYDPEVQKHAKKKLVEAIAYALRNGISIDDIKKLFNLKTKP